MDEGGAGHQASPRASSTVEERGTVEDRGADGDVPQGSEDVAALLPRAQAGDAEAFGLLYDRYVDTVYRFVALRVPSRQIAEDLTSEVFLRALRRIDTFSWQGRDFAAWLVTIARNLVADHYKSSRVRLETVVADATEQQPPVLSDGPEVAVLDALRDERLLEAVQGLPDEQRDCVSLRFLQGLSVSETGRVLGKNDGAVKALQYRAVRALARALDGVAL